MNMQNPNPPKGLTLSPDLMKDALQLASFVAPKRATVPVLGTAFLQSRGKHGEQQSLTLTTTDLDIHLTQTLEAAPHNGFEATVPIKALSSMLGNSDGPVDMSISDDVLTMAAADAEVKINLVSHPEDFPERSEIAHQLKEQTPIEISETELHRLLHLCRHCISTEETRYYLNGVYLCAAEGSNTLRAIATDGHRLARIDSETVVSEAPSVILHTKLIDLLLKIAKPKGNRLFRLYVGELWVCILTDGIEIVSRVIDGTFPDYTRVIPAEDGTLSASLSKASINRMRQLMVSIGASDQSGVSLDCDTGTICARSSGQDEVKMPLQVSSGTGQIGFSMAYLAAQAKITPEFRLTAASAGDPARIKGEDPNALWILMPRRV